MDIQNLPILNYGMQHFFTMNLNKQLYEKNLERELDLGLDSFETGEVLGKEKESEMGVEIT